VDQEVPYNQVHPVYIPVKEGLQEWDYTDVLSNRDPDREGNLHADPTAIPDEFLVIQDREGGDRYHQPRVLCTNKKVYDAAVETLAEKGQQMVDRRIARAAKSDVAASRDTIVANCLPELVVVGTLLPNQREILNSACEALKIKPWGETGPANFYDFLVDLGDDPREALLQLLLYRFLRAPDGGEMDPRIQAHSVVAKELRTQLVAELGKKITLPTWKEKETPAPEGEED
jgi:hypothetical protein